MAQRRAGSPCNEDLTPSTRSLYRQLFGSTTFSLDPHQIGLGNDEAIEAGAFWFYRKLGFRSTDAAIERVVLREEQRMANQVFAPRVKIRDTNLLR